MIALPGALVAAFCALPQHSLAPWHTAPRAGKHSLAPWHTAPRAYGSEAIVTCKILSLSLCLSVSLSFFLLSSLSFSLPPLSLYLWL